MTTTTKTYEIATYAASTSRSGRLCEDPTREYGEDWRYSADLDVWAGTASEIREAAAGTRGDVAVREQLDWLETCYGA